jgi:hypothetical protein
VCIGLRASCRVCARPAKCCAFGEQRRALFPNPPKPGIYRLKIHGALDIFTFNDGEDLVKLVPDGAGENSITEAPASPRQSVRITFV